jgi:hypothetical protein
VPGLVSSQAPFGAYAREVSGFGACRSIELRHKRGDTHVGTIESKYSVDLGLRSDAYLKTALERNGVDSLGKLLNKVS